MKHLLVNLFIALLAAWLAQEVWFLLYENQILRFTYSMQDTLWLGRLGLVIYAVIKAVVEEYIWQGDAGAGEGV